MQQASSGSGSGGTKIALAGFATENTMERPTMRPHKTTFLFIFPSPFLERSVSNDGDEQNLVVPPPRQLAVHVDFSGSWALVAAKAKAFC
jgi:hypothetical protein